jgi:hypothetical protein
LRQPSCSSCQSGELVYCVITRCCTAFPVLTAGVAGAGTAESGGPGGGAGTSNSGVAGRTVGSVRR